MKTVEVNQVEYNEDATDSIVNLAGKEDNSINWSKYMTIHTASNWERRTPAVNRFKEVFGRQMTTVNYSRRFCIWTFSCEGTEVWCLINNQKGICLEYNTLEKVDNIDYIIGWIIDKLQHYSKAKEGQDG